jgi:hypothetical protein
MASRRLLLGYGPSEVASMSIIWENKTGVFIDARKSFHENLPNLDELFDVLQYSYLNRTDEALEYAKVHFDINRIQAEFKRYFIKTI